MKEKISIVLLLALFAVSLFGCEKRTLRESQLWRVSCDSPKVKGIFREWSHYTDRTFGGYAVDAQVDGRPLLRGERFKITLPFDGYCTSSTVPRSLESRL